MADHPDRWLFEPATAHAMVLARRPAGDDAVGCVVSDVVWSDVVALLRWAAAGTRRGPTATGVWWRLAAGCAALLRRLPGLADELGEPLTAVGSRPGADGGPAVGRVQTAAERLTALVRSSDPLPLAVLAAEIDALGAAAIAALAEQTDWQVEASPWAAGGSRPA